MRTAPMSRFSNLETTAPKQPPPQRGMIEHGVESSAPIIGENEETLADSDAAGCVRQGDEAFFRGDYKNGMRWYSRAIDKDSRSIEAWVGLVRMLLLKGDLQDAYTWLGRGLTVFPSAPQLMALRGANYARRGMLRQAMSNTDAVLEQNPNLAIAHMARGEALLFADNKQADHCFEQAVKLTPTLDWKTPMLIGMIFEERRQWARAIVFYTRAAERSERHPALWYHVGLCRAQLGQGHLARKAFDQAEALCVADDPLLLKLSKAKTGSLWGKIIGVFRKK